MKILVDIGHPAHVHYFRNFIGIMKDRGHLFLVSARDRSVIFDLLERYNIPYFSRGRGRDGVAGKISYMISTDIRLLSRARKFRPDIFISFASPYAAQTAWLLGVPHFALDDTEHAKFGHLFYRPFTSVFLNPSCFRKDFGKRQIRFSSYAELMYLHPRRFEQNAEIRSVLNIKENDRVALLRFVSWKANHDLGHSGLDLSTKKELVNVLEENNFKVIISAESENVDPFFEKFIYRNSPHLIHDIMVQADLMVTEGATMASECAMLGTPAIYVNSLDAGTLREQEDKYQLIHGFRSSARVIDKVLEIISLPDAKKEYGLRRDKMLSEKIDITSFLVWFTENYPDSFKIMKENPEYQKKFS